MCILVHAVGGEEVGAGVAQARGSSGVRGRGFDLANRRVGCCGKYSSTDAHDATQRTGADLWVPDRCRGDGGIQSRTCLLANLPTTWWVAMAIAWCALADEPAERLWGGWANRTQPAASRFFCCLGKTHRAMSRSDHLEYDSSRSGPGASSRLHCTYGGTGPERGLLVMLFADWRSLGTKIFCRRYSHLVPFFWDVFLLIDSEERRVAIFSFRGLQRCGLSRSGKSDESLLSISWWRSATSRRLRLGLPFFLFFRLVDFFAQMSHGRGLPLEQPRTG